MLLGSLVMTRVCGQHEHGARGLSASATTHHDRHLDGGPGKQGSGEYESAHVLEAIPCERGPRNLSVSNAPHVLTACWTTSSSTSDPKTRPAVRTD